MSKQIKRAEKRGAKRWAARYRSTFEAVMADKVARIKTLETFVTQLVEASGAPCPELLCDTIYKLRKQTHEPGAGADGCVLPCFRLQQEQVAVSSLEHDVRAAEKRAKEFHAGWLDAIVRAGDAEQEVKRLTADGSLWSQVGTLTAERDRLQADLAESEQLRTRHRAEIESAVEQTRHWSALAKAMTAERDQIRALNAELHAANGQVLGRVGQLRAEVEDLGRRYLAAENDLNRVFDACGLTSGTVDRMVERVKELRAGAMHGGETVRDAIDKAREGAGTGTDDGRAGA